MGIKDIKAEARGKLALNIHQAVVLYLIEYAVFTTLLVVIVLACVSIGSIHLAAAIVFICYGSILLLVAFVGMGVLNHAMVDYYLASYKCKPYNIRRLGDTLARNGLMKVFLLNVKRVLLGFLLCLCLIVPGVIYLMRTSMAANLLIANPKMKASTALSASSKVMSGKVGSYFSLMMSMFGWWVLGFLTFGLGFIFIMPYINLCKTVYYKRNLQGDKTVYRTVVQPVSPPTAMPVQQQMPPQMQQQMQQQMQAMQNVQYMQNAQNMQNVQPVQQQPQYDPNMGVPPIRPMQPPTQPIQSNGAVPNTDPMEVGTQLPPIDALGDDDISELNAAMRELESDEPQAQKIPDVPEVPISPTVKTKPKMQSSEKTAVGEYNIENCDLIETVKPLTTREVEESDVMGRKIDRMFSGSETSKVGEKHDYFSDLSKSGPNDFVTSESESVDMKDIRTNILSDSADVNTDSVMSDADFAKFIENFDFPKSSGKEFTPLTRSPRAAKEREQAEPSHAEPKREVPRTTGADGESRLERIRREREERRRNTGK